MDENFRVRFLIEELIDVADNDLTFQLQYNKNGAGWNDVDAASTNVRSSAGQLVDGNDTTEQLSGPGTFLTANEGQDEVNGLAGGTTLDFTSTANQEVEMEYCCQIRSADAVGGDTIQLRVINGKTSTVLDVYTNTPTVTVLAAEYTQQSFIGRNDDGTEITATQIAAENINFDQVVDANFRIRFLLLETADRADANVEFQLQYNKNGGGWNNVDAASTNVRSFASGNFADGATTTQQLGSGTFITPNDGMDEVNGLAGGANLDFTSTVNQEVEVEYCVQIRSADVSDFDTIQLRVIMGVGLGQVLIFTNTPTVTATPPAHWIMTTSANFADGDPTTEQLTAPTGIFRDGEMKEDDGINSAIALLKEEFTEHEYCMQATTDATSAAQYEFRVVDLDQAGEKLETYTKIPKNTLT